jgi:3-deoxy-D-manno-octulosonic-acid transferase
VCDAAKRLIEVNGAIIVPDANAVAGAIGALLADATRRQTMGEAARTFVRNQQGATERTLDVLDRLIAPPT